MATPETKLSELTFQLIVESTPNAIVLVNQEGKIAYINSQCEKLFGYHRNELIGQLVETLIPQRYRANHPGFRRMFFNAPSVRSMGAGRELFALRKDGTEFPIEIGLNPLVLVDGTWVLASIIDITQRKRAEEQFRLVVNSAPNAMVLINQEGNISLVNDQAQRLFGYEEKEMIGQKLEILIPERFRGKHVSFRDTFFTKPEARSMGAGRDLFGVKKNGEEIPIEIGLNPIKTDTGLVVLASVIDITERKQQEEMRARKEAAEAADKAKSSFLAIMSHEIRTPMNGIIGMTNLLMQSELNEQQAKMCRIVQQCGDSLLTVINDILDFSKIEAGKLEITPTQFDLSLLIYDTLTLLTPVAEKKGIALFAEIAPTLHHPLLGDDGRIRQILTNLISNAIKFTEQGNVTVIADCLSGSANRTAFRIVVRDTGVGIPEAAQSRLFQPFAQADSSVTRKFGGSGLGLSICRQLVLLMGGEIGFTSTPGSGSEFWFKLELANCPVAKNSSSKIASTPTTTERPPQPSRALRLLVADDSEVNQMVAYHLLESLGYEADVVSSGEEALERLAKEPYDAVFMDCQMPGLDGYEATRRIRSGEIKGINPKVRIIALTASAMSDDRVHCFKAGMDDFLSKPIRVNEMKTALERAGLC